MPRENLEFYDKLVASVPSGLMDLLDIPGLGGKKIKVLHEQLKVDSIESLTEVCQAGKVAELKGFGEKTQEKILSGIQKPRGICCPASLVGCPCSG